MIDVANVLIRPVITEKAGSMKEVKKYAFEIAPNANKIQVKKAIETLYKVTVDKVNIVNVKPKPKRLRMNFGYTKKWKKAIITLSKGEIDVYK
jgi:large subunit ribosomal protein L23